METVSPESKEALGGVKVLEWAQLVAGPYCAKLLADLGAEVIKIERPGVGDEARHRSPFAGNHPHPEKSLLFLYLNTNKLSVILDMENPVERDKFLALLKWADVLIEDNMPRDMDRLGLTYENLRKINPKLVMTSITPFGQTGPYRDYKAYPLNVYNAGGLGYLSPRRSRGTFDTPLKSGGFFNECSCGLVAAVGTVAALYAQRTTSLGQQVDISKQEATLSLCRVRAARYPNEGVIQSRFDQANGLTGMFPCKDGYVVEATNKVHEWMGLAKMVGCPEWESEEYRDQNFRGQHWDEISKHMISWLKDYTMAEVTRKGHEVGCPVAPVMSAKDIVESEQLQARGFFVEAEHPAAGKLKYPSVSYQFSATPFRVERTAPLLGQHTQEVMDELLDSSNRVLAAGVANPIGEAEGKVGRGPLAGIRVADFSWAWAGAHSTELLAFLGAEVIKVESLKNIDFARQLSFTTGQKFDGLNKSYVFNDINLGKKSVRLNLSHPKGVELAKRLVSMSDVVAQNMRPAVMDRLGLGYEALRKVKPDIVYLSSCSRGSVGPERNYAGYAPSFSAWGGISYITGASNGVPMWLTGEIDLLSAVTATYAMLVAIYHHRMTGEGQHVDLSSAETINVLIGEVIMDYTANGRIQKPRGNLDEFMAPHNCYRCQGEDKWISIAIATDEEWQSFCRVLGNPEWCREPRFATARGRWENQEALDKYIEKWTINYSHYQVMEILQQAGVAATPVFNAEELFNNPHLNDRKCWMEFMHPVLGKQCTVNPAWKLSATPAGISSAAPLFGQHSHQVFKELLGLTDGEIARLEEEKVIY